MKKEGRIPENEKWVPELGEVPDSKPGPSGL